MNRPTILETTKGLTPPRPNLGPEPWVDSVGRGPIAGLLATGLVLILLSILWRWRVSRKTPPVEDLDRGPTDPVAADTSPRTRLIAAAESIREALVSAHGLAWASKTTEEMAGQTLLVERLGMDRANRLVALFRISDRAKFGGVDPDSVEDWETWSGQLLEEWSGLANSKVRSK